MSERGPVEVFMVRFAVSCVVVSLACMAVWPNSYRATALAVPGMAAIAVALVLQRLRFREEDRRGERR